ncbi:MAG: Rid family detoxifying hydrolase [Aquificaceae bacterium]|nr:Rid family detoxifying hydrolase [Aquificaceae bacterium]MCX8075748.1 Rid family detoxifying hydrolase [Aquificaceae bacterium]MDW8434171.1 Rid family detoxifying hydrolase [Aquificaceae bacterium]
MTPVYTEEAPKPVGPYSQAVMVGGFIFLSGQIGIDAKEGKLKEGFRQQVEQAFRNIDAILKSVGASREKIVRVVVYLKDLSLFGEFNQLYEEFFSSVRVKPTRTTVGVNELPLGAQIEIEVLAYVGE